VTFDDATRRLLDGKNFASLSTLNPDGGPQSSVVWMLRDGDALLFSALDGRRKVRNLLRDPRVSVTVFDLDNPYHSVEIRGRATVSDDPDRELPDRLSRKYLGASPPPEPAELRRVVIRVLPERINTFAV